MHVRFLPLLAGLAPLIAAYSAFGIGVLAGVLEPCIPFIDGCHSISATGRKPPGSFLFRAVMLPQAVILLLTWYFTIYWLKSLNPGFSRGTRIAIHVSSIISALALVSYVTFLGTREPFYEFMRRFGIYFFFIGTVLVEILVAVALIRMRYVLENPRLKRLTQAMLALCLIPFVLGAVNFYLKATLENPDQAENVIEWIVATMMHIYLLLMFRMWQITKYAVSPSVGAD